MGESWLRVGEPILISSGLFQGLEGTVTAIDPPSDTAGVTVNVFLHTRSLTFALSTADEHLAPFGDQPPVPRCPYEDGLKQELLSLCPVADTVYQSRFFR